MKKQSKFKNWVLTVICGCVIGFVNGFFGAGGGMICVPLLEKVLKLSNQTSHATAIGVILPISVISAIVYSQKVDVQNLNLLWVTAGVMVGGIVGALLLKKLSSKVVRLVFALVMLSAGIWIVVR
ncbi:MAG: sulfite exporter TauE/SafE family protein [Clostridia bacterium]